MSNDTSDNAFPIPGLQEDPIFNGLSKREYFAAQALQGLMAGESAEWNYGTSQRRIAAAVSLADMLIAELARK